jgi:hypothetical protein
LELGAEEHTQEELANYAADLEAYFEADTRAGFSHIVCTLKKVCVDVEVMLSIFDKHPHLVFMGSGNDEKLRSALP